MKFLKYLFFTVIILCVIVICGLTFLFSSSGNNMIKSYAQNLIKEKTGLVVNFKKFELNFGDFNITADINNEISANVFGKYGLFARSFNVNYALNVNDLSTFNLKLKDAMDFRGKAGGTIDKFAVNGSGKAFDSNINFLAKIDEFKPEDVDLNAKNINLSKVLEFLNMPKYLKQGSLNVIAKIKNENGNANINSQNAVLNEAVFKERNITFPNNLAISLNSDINIKDLIATAKTDINSEILNINAQKTVYDINKKTLQSDFSVDIQDLSKLEAIIHQKLKGSLAANGEFKFEDEKIESLNADIKGFGGNISANLKDSKLNAKLNNLELSNLIALANMPAFANGKINGDVKIDDIYNTSKITGDATIAVNDGKISQKEFAKLTNINVADNTAFTLNSDAKVDSGDIKLNANLKSDLLNVNKLIANYNLNTKNAKANLSANIADMSKLNVGLKGSAKINADADIKDNNLAGLKADISALDGTIDVLTDGKTLEANVKNIELLALFAMIGEPAYSSGKINAKVNLKSFEPKNLNGDVTLKISNANLVKSTMDKLTKKSFPKNVQFSADADIKLKKSVANFAGSLKSDLADLSELNGSFDINNGVLNSNFSANIPDFSRLDFLVGRKLNGSIKLNGNAAKDKDFKVNVTSDFLGGKLNANLLNQDFKASLKDFDVKELMHFLDYSDFYRGKGMADFKYNIAKENGIFDVLVKEGYLTENKLTTAIKLATGVDLSDEVYKDATLKGTINKNKVNFNANMKAKRSEINVKDGKVDTLTKAIDIPVYANVEKTDLDISVTGTTENPKVKVSSKYLEKKLDKVIDKGLNKILGGGKEEEQDESGESGKNITKELIKGIFK